MSVYTKWALYKAFRSLKRPYLPIMGFHFEYYKFCNNPELLPIPLSTIPKNDSCETYTENGLIMQ